VAGLYATASELGAYWRPLSDLESARATVLLQAAGDLIDEQEGSDSFVLTACKWVSLDMVKRAMISMDGITSQSQGMGDMNVSQTFANPMGRLQLQPRELRRLKGLGVESRLFSLAGTNNVRVPYTVWGYQYASQTDGAITPAPPG
jgi:hypothetical protein